MVSLLTWKLKCDLLNAAMVQILMTCYLHISKSETITVLFPGCSWP